MGKNKRLDITGFLHYRQGRFVQYLEGNEEPVTSLMNTIADDERHRVILRVDLERRAERLFPDWSMRYITANELDLINLEDVLESMLEQFSNPVYEIDRVRQLATDIIRKISARRADIGK